MKNYALLLLLLCLPAYADDIFPIRCYGYAIGSDGSGFPYCSQTLNTELNFLSGTRSNVQAQIDGIIVGATSWGTITGTLSSQTDLNTALNLRAPKANPTFTGTIGTPLSTSACVVTDGSSNLASSSTTATEIGYVHGVTGALQTQINTKAPTASPTFTGTIATPLTASKVVQTDSSANLTTGTVTVAQGGSNATSLAGHGAVVMNSGGTAMTIVAPGTNGNVLTSNGTDWTSSAGGGGGIASINSDSTSAQVITGSNNISASTSAGTTTINGTLLAPKASPTLSGVVTISSYGSSVAPSLQFPDGNGIYTLNNNALQIDCQGGTRCAYLSNSQWGIPPSVFLNLAGNANIDNWITAGSTSDSLILSGDENDDLTQGGTIKLTARSYSGANAQIQFYNAGTLNGKIDSSGHWFMPNLATSSAAQTGTVCSGTSGQLTVDTTTTCLASTRKIKKNIDPLDVGLAEVLQLQPISYDLRQDRGEGRQVGLIAEDVAQVDKRLVAMDDKGEPRAVRYQQLTAVLIKAIQEQQAEIKELKSRVRDLETITK